MDLHQHHILFFLWVTRLEYQVSTIILPLTLTELGAEWDLGCGERHSWYWFR